MPTFDFQCTGCDHIFEFNRPFGSEELPSCPECKSKKVQKLLSTPNIQFKGEGFYKTDSGSKPTLRQAQDGSGQEEKKPKPSPESSAKSADSGQADKKVPKPQKDSKKDPK